MSGAHPAHSCASKETAVRNKDWRKARVTGWGVLANEALMEWSEYTQKSKMLGRQVREKPPFV